MKSAPKPFSRILLAYDGSADARRALYFAAALARGSRLVEHIAVLRVIGGSYLARHVKNVDLRVTRLEEVREWRRVRRRYLEQEIRPQLQEAGEYLARQGVAIPIDLRRAEGRVGEEILKLAEAEGFTTIILGRRGLSSLKELLLGSVTRTVTHRARGLTVLVVGSKGEINPDCPVTPLLVPVDGSDAGQAAVWQAAVLPFCMW
ncbi:MAG: universal stress protein [Deltaproteobacteria bacterium]|nr:universal stress protein [Deltaproteobacteria bacterium]